MKISLFRMWGHLLLLAVLATAFNLSSASVCTSAASGVTYTSRQYNRKCGLWGWGRCKLYEQKSQTTYYLQRACCPNTYGHVETGCSGECQYDSASKSAQCTTGSGICRDYVCDRSGFQSPPSSVTINENNNREVLLWKTNGTSFVQYQEQGRVRRDLERFEEDTVNDHVRDKRAVEWKSENVQATECVVASTNEIAEVRNGIEIYRKACINPSCKECGADDIGCLNHGESYQVKVSCYAPGYTNKGVIEHTFSIEVEKAADVELVIPEELLDEPAQVNSEMVPGDVVFTLSDIQIPSGEDFSIELDSPVSERNGEPLFEWNDETNQVVVASDLSDEPSGTHFVQLCARQRRGDSCIIFEVSFEKITTTTTTTTTTPTTTDAGDEYLCQARGIWKTIEGFDLWCDRMCKENPYGCVYKDFCVCVGVHNEHLPCTSGGVWQSPVIDAWCFLNCNYGNYSHCPTITDNPDAYCYCEE